MIINPSIEFSLPVILFSIIFLSGCGTDVKPLAETTPRVKYFEVGEQATGQSRRISGKLIAADTSVLSFSVSGTIEQVLVSRGDTVLQGQVLAVLDMEPLRLAVEQARAQLNIARAKVTETKQIYDRTVTLFNKRASSQAEVDTATANHAAARGNLKAAQSDLDRKQRDLSNAELTAPFAGTIAERNIDPFQETTVGQGAFLLQSSDALEVDVRIPETMIRDIDYGQRVQVTFPTIQGTSLTGVVSEIGSRVGAGNAFPVKIQLSASQTKLLPGMTASVTFNFNEYLEGSTVYLIPLAAIAIEFSMLRQAKESSSQVPQKTAPVFVIDDNYRLQVRDVVIGDLRGNQLEVYEGLEAGEKIVSAGVTFLHENMKVELWTPEQGLTDG
ncbi:MAG: efflux RND transporter periplasmic adaptor subunit [Planctomycetia bacterium]|uniref:efflux RND transporter periplasmic adaptor subunit n=1 Tax=Candidatus Kuenenia sp. TaxID=2499824 RepID=UPI001D2CDEF6|nr:efflux RND transporter periplasmic adaptor subunit [Planctomycetia bacterium]